MECTEWTRKRPFATEVPLGLATRERGEVQHSSAQAQVESFSGWSMLMVMQPKCSSGFWHVETHGPMGVH